MVHDHPVPLPPNHPFRNEVLPHAPGMLDGDERAVRFCLQQLRTFAGATLDLPSPGVTVVVGGNNVGKSTLLREIHQQVQVIGDQKLAGSLLVQRLVFHGEGTPGDFLAWLSHRAALSKDSGGNWVMEAAASTRKHTMGAGEVNRLHNLCPPDERTSLWPFDTFLVSYADTQARLDLSMAAPVREDARLPPIHPVHVLADDDARFARAAELAERIFGVHLVLDEISAANRLRVSSGPISLTGESGRLDQESRDRLLQLPELADQGDGMRSLIGLLLPLLAAGPPLALIDEPEAFLHPPQAAALGRALGELARDESLQLVLATHDRSLLAGLLGAPDVQVSIVRLDRPAVGPTVAHQLDVERVRLLAADPVLRYTNALEGLFHSQVVLGESSDDCSFYNAALDASHETEPLPIRPSEVLFVPCSGKSGMARLASALRELHVPVVATPDLDVLNDMTVLSTLVEALKPGAWLSLETDYRLAVADLRQPRDRLTSQQVQQSVDHILSANPDTQFDDDLRKRVQVVLRAGESRFKALKEHGMSAFRGGAVRQAADRLLSGLDAIGLVVVKEGELERFAPAVDVRKGAGWLPAALEGQAHKTQLAADHVRRFFVAESIA